MTPRERVHTALQHKEPDQVPIDSNGIVSSIHETAYAALVRYLGREEQPVILDPVQRIVLASEEVLQELGVDTRYLYPKPPAGWRYQEDAEGYWKDEFGVTYKRVGFYADCVAPPLRGADLAAVKAYRFPDPTDHARFKGLREKALALHQSTGYALVSGSMLSFDYIRWILRGLEDAIADLYTEPRLAEYLLDAVIDWMIAYGQAIMAEIGDLIEFFWVGDDWGAQGGPFYGPALFRSTFAPRIAKLIGAMKSRTNAKCAYHCCGAVRWAIPDLIEAGVDILHPLQPNAEGNGDSARIKAEFGGRLCFHGGTNNQGLFHDGPAELQVDTLGRLREADMPPENLTMLFAICRVFGRYPLDIPAINARVGELS